MNTKSNMWKRRCPNDKIPRGWAVGALAVAGLAELWTVATVEVVLSQGRKSSPMVRLTISVVYSPLI